MEDDNYTCGRNEVAGLANNDSVHVSAAGSCVGAGYLSLRQINPYFVS
jgi:hypothetical protein